MGYFLDQDPDLVLVRRIGCCSEFESFKAKAMMESRGYFFGNKSIIPTTLQGQHGYHLISLTPSLHEGRLGRNTSFRQILVDWGSRFASRTCSRLGMRYSLLCLRSVLWIVCMTWDSQRAEH